MLLTIASGIQGTPFPTVMVLLYFAPTILYTILRVVSIWNKPEMTSRVFGIFLFNLVLGWTIVVWIFLFFGSLQSYHRRGTIRE